MTSTSYNTYFPAPSTIYIPVTRVITLHPPVKLLVNFPQTYIGTDIPTAIDPPDHEEAVPSLLYLDRIIGIKVQLKAYRSLPTTGVLELKST